MVQDIVNSSLTQLGVIPQDAPNQSQAQSSNEDPEPLQTEDVSSEGELSDSDQEDPHSRTPALYQLLITAEEQADYDSFSLPVATRPAPAYFPQPQAAPPRGIRRIPLESLIDEDRLEDFPESEASLIAKQA